MHVHVEPNATRYTSVNIKKKMKTEKGENSVKYSVHVQCTIYNYDTVCIKTIMIFVVREGSTWSRERNTSVSKTIPILNMV